MVGDSFPVFSTVSEEAHARLSRSQARKGDVTRTLPGDIELSNPRCRSKTGFRRFPLFFFPMVRVHKPRNHPDRLTLQPLCWVFPT